MSAVPNMILIRTTGGGKVRAAKFELRGAIYWLGIRDAKVAQDWDKLKPDENITRAAFIQRQAVKIDRPAPLEEANTAAKAPRHGRHFWPGDVVTLKSGGAQFTVESCDDETVDLIATDYGPRFLRESLPIVLVKAWPAPTAELEMPF